MDLSKSLKKILISSAALLMTGSIIGTGNVANAKHRRYHYRYARRARRNVYKYGYYKHGRYHYYKTGYFRNGKWIKRHTKSHRHAKYMWIDNPNTNKYVRVQVVGKKYMNNEKDEPYYIFKSNNKQLIYANGWPVRKGYGAAWGPGNLSPYIFAHNPAASSNNNDDSNNNSDNVTTPVYHNHKDSTARNLAETKSQTVTDINNDRESNGRQPVQENSQMDQIANMRAKQASKNFTHYDPSTNQPYELEDANKLGINFGKGAETDSNGVTHSYVFTENLADNYGNNGKQIANNANNDLMYHDQDQGNGHRKNILYKPWRYVGIGTAPAKGEYSGDTVIAEDFASWVK